MTCQIIKVNSKKSKKNLIQKAAEIIKRGGLVAFPTETVYGLGADALNKKAVRKIFKLKRRPLDNPLIVHIAHFDDLFKLVKEIPQTAKILAKKFWPGPLTLVLPKKKIVPDEVTAGQKTVAIRMPRNKIALELIKTAKVPLAAPSANLASRPSPTTAKHVFDDLGNKIDLILDGGRTKIGLESTVLDLTVKPHLILRPGGITLEKLRKVSKDIKLHPFLFDGKLKTKIVKSPGMRHRHYAPKASLILIEEENPAPKIQKLIAYYQRKKKIVGVMVAKENKKFYQEADLVLSPGSRENLKEVAQNLFKTLREFDKQKVDIILTESFPEKGIGFAIMNRLKKAASKE